MTRASITFQKMELNNIERSLGYLKIISIVILVLICSLVPLWMVSASFMNSGFMFYVAFWLVFMLGYLYLKNRFIWQKCQQYLKVYDVFRSKRILLWDTITMIIIVGFIFGTASFLFEGFEPIWFFEMFFAGVLLSSLWIGVFYPFPSGLSKEDAIREREKIDKTILKMLDEMMQRELRISEKKGRLREIGGELLNAELEDGSAPSKGRARSEFIKKLRKIESSDGEEARMEALERFIQTEINIHKYRSFETLVKNLLKELNETLEYLRKIEKAYDDAIERESEPVLADMVPVRDKPD